MAVPALSLVHTLSAPLRTPLGGLFENAVLLNLLEGGSAKKRVGTWRKSAASAVEVDFVMDAPELGIKIPIECKAALVARPRHAQSLAEYLRATHQRVGVLVTAAPLGVVYRSDDACIINVPAYLATKRNILRYSEALLNEAVTGFGNVWNNSATDADANLRLQ